MGKGQAGRQASRNPEPRREDGKGTQGSVLVGGWATGSGVQGNQYIRKAGMA